MSELAAFVGVSLLVIVTPGQDTALTIRNTLRGGRRGGLFTALGVVTGQLTWALATSAGLAAVVTASEPAFLALRLFGAAYLVYLGVQALRGRIDSAPRPALAGAGAYHQGVLSNLGNPKMAVFFTGLLPQFAQGRPSFLALVPLGALFAALTLVWLSAYAFAVARARNVFLRPAMRRALDRATGTVLVALGVRLAAEQG
jgi:threonine/homoserine/homoserine lactone efflux protein